MLNDDDDPIKGTVQAVRRMLESDRELADCTRKWSALKVQTTWIALRSTYFHYNGLAVFILQTYH